MKKFGKILLAIVVLNLAVTSIVNRFTHSEKTETELFKDIPKAFIYQF